jgi:hypothetical protein
LHDITAATFPEIVRRIFTQQSTAFTINVSFGFMWTNVEAEEPRYTHPSQSKVRFCDLPHWIRGEEDIVKFLAYLSRQDMLECIRQQRPDTLTNVAFTSTSCLTTRLVPELSFQTIF